MMTMSSLKPSNALSAGTMPSGESREQGEKGDEVVAELAPGEEAHHADDDGEGERLIDCHDARAIAGTVAPKGFWASLGASEEVASASQSRVEALRFPKRSRAQLKAPWQCLYFLPEPHGQSAFRCTLPQVEGSAGFGPWAWLALRLRAGAAAPFAVTAGPTLAASSANSSSPGGRIEMMGLHGRKLGGIERRNVFLARELDMHELAGHRLAQARQHVLEQREALALIFVQRVALAIAAQADDLAEMLERDEMLAPQMIEGL